MLEHLQDINKTRHKYNELCGGDFLSLMSDIWSVTT